MWFTVDGAFSLSLSASSLSLPPSPQGAVIAPSEEDSQSFSISGANSEVYKLRAIDAKQRQYWVSRLRREVENCTNQFGSLVRQQSLMSLVLELTLNTDWGNQTFPFLSSIPDSHSYIIDPFHNNILIPILSLSHSPFPILYTGRISHPITCCHSLQNQQ